MKKLFEGTLRSVLVCQVCGNKRVHVEPFLSLTLPLSTDDISNNKGLSVEHCLRQYTLPELLVDHVDCSSCKKKTPTKKQQVIGRLPTVLCLHFKRYDASLDRPILDFVSFPSHGLNMGIYLPHW
jgi:ubiquitin C-terminal hydrolase